MTIIEKINQKIIESQKILLLTHENPDGDALGSLAAFALTLYKLSKKIDCACTSDIPRIFNFIPLVDKIKKDFILGDYDLIIILDCGDIKRTGFSDRLKELNRYKKRIINIDHHSKNDLHRLAEINYIDYEASSTAELIYRIFDFLNWKIDKDIATSLLCGLYFDTGAFRHSNTTKDVLKISSYLLSCGAKLKLITQNISNGKSVAALKLWGKILSRIKQDKGLGLVSSVITLKDIEECQASPNDLAGAVNLINTIPGSRAAILFSEIESGKIKASLRTERNDVDVSRLANIFGGGGLKKASGFSLDGRIIPTDNGWEIQLS